MAQAGLIILFLTGAAARAIPSGADLIRALDDPNQAIRVEAIRELGQRKERLAAERLIELIGDSDPRVPWEAIRALGQIQDSSAIDPIIEVMLSSRFWDMRWVAAEALGEIGNTRALGALERAAKDENAKVRSAVKRSLEKILGAGSKKNKGDRGERKKPRRSTGSQMPAVIYLGVGQKIAYPAQGTKASYGYMCAEDLKEDARGNMIAACCDVQSMAQIAICQSEDPDKLTFVGNSMGRASFKVFRAYAAKTAEKFTVTIKVGGQGTK